MSQTLVFIIKGEVQKSENVEDKRSIFGKVKRIFDNFLKVLF